MFPTALEFVSAHSLISSFWSSVTLGMAETEVEAFAFALALVSVAVVSSSASSSAVVLKGSSSTGARYQSAGLSSVSINHCPWLFRKLRMGGAHCW
jgi:hypothetical protein